MTYKITLIPGDGIGPEVAEATRRVIEATGVKIEWEKVEAGTDVIEKYGTPLPDEVIASVKKNKVAIKGPITTPVGKGFRSVNVAMRHKLDLFACVRPCKYYPGVRSKYKGIDLIIIRENTEDLYAGIEFQKGSEAAAQIIKEIESLQPAKIRSDSGISIKPISVYGSERIVDFAFQYARKYGRKKVTAVHKANIMKFTDGLFLEVAREVAKKYND
ncbi:MAG: isocitrate/isopropylmalate family dehydrogenase, partial [bacterium]